MAKNVANLLRETFLFFQNFNSKLLFQTYLSLLYSLRKNLKLHEALPCGLQKNFIFLIIIRANVRKLPMLRSQEVKDVKCVKIEESGDEVK